MNGRTVAEEVIHPVLRMHAERRAHHFQDRIADRITAFAGSMPFVYVHALWFTGWIVVGIERFPYGLLTMIVSLEAIFLATFVMLSQNRADDKRQALADHQWQLVRAENQQNEELLELSRRILALTELVHERLASDESAKTPQAQNAAGLLPNAVQ